MKYDFHLKKFIETEISPEKIAVAASDADIDWNALKNYTLNFSDQFKNIGIPEGHPIIIYGHKEFLFSVAILACFNSGIPYIPIDKIYPYERIRKISEITGAQVLINCSAEPLDIPFAISINAKLQTKVNFTPRYEDRIYGNTTDPLQYIMFTSGSTGEPKGVQIKRSSVLKFIDWASKDFGFNENDVFLNQAPFTFDVSLCDLLNAFMQGGTLVLTSTDNIKNQDAFINRLAYYKSTVWTSTPSFIYLFLRHPDFNSAILSAIHTFMFMGEELPGRTCKILRNNFKSSRILNAYGPTEATIVTTLIDITDEIINKYPSLPIGFPMPGSELLIEKEKPDDKQGELIIAGDHVSSGYFKNEELNREKFFTYNGKRAFRTGDIAYYESDMLFYSGRNDDQVKMHGFRIELTEISNVICKMSDIADAVTVALKKNNEVKKIISFIILKSAIETENLKKTLLMFLEKTLPYYMIPGDIVVVHNFPYNSSHKIDKNKLINDYLTMQSL
jgi:D-alanine--poly(phosphoribitol) ligase subunit 1